MGIYLCRGRACGRTFGGFLERTEAPQGEACLTGAGFFSVCQSSSPCSWRHPLLDLYCFFLSFPYLFVPFLGSFPCVFSLGLFLVSFPYLPCLPYLPIIPPLFLYRYTGVPYHSPVVRVYPFSNVYNPLLILRWLVEPPTLLESLVGFAHLLSYPDLLIRHSPSCEGAEPATY